MKKILLAVALTLCLFSQAQTIPDSIQKQFTELRQQQAELATIVKYSGKNIKTGAALIAPGLTLLTVGTILGVLPSGINEGEIANMPIKKFAGVICISAGGVFSLAGAISLFNGGKKLQHQKLDEL